MVLNCLNLARLVLLLRSGVFAITVRPPVVAEERVGKAFKERDDNSSAGHDGDAYGGPTTSECELPSYAISEWRYRHGKKLPDHAAIFTSSELARVQRLNAAAVASLEGLARVESLQVEARPGYLAPGAALASLRDVEVRLVRRLTVASLAAAWQAHRLGEFAVHEHSCGAHTLCARLAHLFAVPKFFAFGVPRERRLVCGGRGWSSPLSQGPATWDSLQAGHRDWHLVPPDVMHEALADALAPNLLPARAWSQTWDALVDSQGERPLRCTQKPGEIMFVPAGWWRASATRGNFTLSYGESPDARPIQKSAWASKMRAPFVRAAAANAANAANANAVADWSVASSLSITPWYEVEQHHARLTELTSVLQWDSLKEGNGSRQELDRSIRDLMTHALAPLDARGLTASVAAAYAANQTASYANCVFATLLHALPEDYGRRKAMKQLARAVSEKAQDESIAVYDRQCPSHGHFRGAKKNLHHNRQFAAKRPTRRLGVALLWQTETPPEPHTSRHDRPRRPPSADRADGSV